MTTQQLIYNEYMKSDAWLIIRNAALSRADNHCQLCCRTDNLTVHHNTYERLGNERDADLVVLCATCHNVFHAKCDNRTKEKYSNEKWLKNKTNREYSALPFNTEELILSRPKILSADDVEKIRREYTENKYIGIKTLSKKYGVSFDRIIMAVSDITNRLTPPKREKINQSINKKKITQQRKEIIAKSNLLYENSLGQRFSPKPTIPRFG